MKERFERVGVASFSQIRHFPFQAPSSLAMPRANPSSSRARATTSRASATPDAESLARSAATASRRPSLLEGLDFHLPTGLIGSVVHPIAVIATSTATPDYDMALASMFRIAGHLRMLEALHGLLSSGGLTIMLDGGGRQEAPRGVGKAALAANTDIRRCTDVERGTQCSVCCGNLTARANVRVLRHCGHYYHTKCIDRWLRNNETCPLCRCDVVVASDGTGADSTHSDESTSD